MTKTEPCPQYTKEQIRNIKTAYIIGIIVWIVIIASLGLLSGPIKFLHLVILMIPIVLFILGYLNADQINEDSQEKLQATNFLTLGLLIAFPILSWVYDKSKSKKSYFNKLLIAAIIISIIPIFDIWVPCNDVPVIIHIKSIIRTFSLGIFIYALYIFYLERKNYEENNNNGNAHLHNKKLEANLSLVPFIEEFPAAI